MMWSFNALKVEKPAHWPTVVFIDLCSFPVRSLSTTSSTSWITWTRPVSQTVSSGRWGTLGVALWRSLMSWGDSPCILLTCLPPYTVDHTRHQAPTCLEEVRHRHQSPIQQWWAMCGTVCVGEWNVMFIRNIYILQYVLQICVCF